MHGSLIIRILFCQQLISHDVIFQTKKDSKIWKVPVMLLSDELKRKDDKIRLMGGRMHARSGAQPDSDSFGTSCLFHR